jgi:hypothetical protein
MDQADTPTRALPARALLLRRVATDPAAVVASDAPAALDLVRERPLPAAVCLVAIGLFLAYSLNFLYFFVDDEAIPFVYAQNLLNGAGLSYNPLDGPVEGYSDFLHVLNGALLLSGVKALALDKLTVFFYGKIVSLASAAGLILLTFRAMRDLGVRRTGAVTGLLALALAGPLAVWACSSLETCFFAWLVMGVAYALLDPDRRRWLGGLCATAAVLERIDGGLYVAVLVAAFHWAHAPAQRRVIRRAIAAPAAAALLGYHAWRVWYFREWLPMPLYAKVAFKLRPARNLLTKSTPLAYTAEFLRLYAGGPLLCLAAAVTPLARRDRRIVSLQVSLVLLAIYVTIVGDWMFGFRFFVPLLPLMALLLAVVITAIGDWSRVGQRVVAAACIAGAVAIGYRFEQAYEARENRASFLRHPSFEAQSFFHPYYELFVASRALVPPQTLIATNQAGLVPFLLDVPNIDNLGLCSKFYARLPTTDGYFTEVGRYAPLTNKPVFRAGDAYLLYREPAYIIERGDLLRAANMGHAPQEILGGAYRAIWTDRDNTSVIYTRTDRPIEEFKQDPNRFVENLAHVSSLREAIVNDERVDPINFFDRLGYLADGVERVEVTSRYEAALRFGDEDTAVRELYVQSVYTSEPAVLSLTLRSADGHLAWQRVVDLPARTERVVHERLPDDVRASRLTLTVAGTAGQPLYVRLTDVRVQGQSDALRRYIRRTLNFHNHG